MAKCILRQTMLARRKGIPLDEVRSASLIVQQTLISTGEFAYAKIVAIYSSIRNEVETSEVMAAALSSDKVLLLPEVAGNGLIFKRVSGEGDLRCGSYGILEPTAECPVYSPGDADLIVVPGVVFDEEGRRIGYGKGYYDRALHKLERKGKLVGFCYDFQLVDRIVDEPHDVLMDMIITERRVIRP